MSQPVNVPAVGPVNRRWIVYGGLAVVGIVGYAYWKRSRSPGTVYDPAGGTVDLGTGGYQNPAPTSPPSGPVDDNDLITSNSQWSAAAISALVGIGFNPQFAATTIGKYLAGMELTPEEADVIRAAFGLVGEPPNAMAIIVRQGTGNGPTPSSGTTTRHVSEGTQVKWTLMEVQGYRPTFTVAELLAMNPGASTAPADGDGYISPDNPANGPVELAWSADQTITIPAR